MSVFKHDEVERLKRIGYVINQVDVWQASANRDLESIKSLEDQIESNRRSYRSNMGYVTRYEEELRKLRQELISSMNTIGIVELPQGSGQCKIVEDTGEIECRQQ